MAHQALALQFGQHRERRLDGPFGGVVRVDHDPEVDDVEHVQAEVAQVVVHRLAQLVGREGGVPRFVLAASGADLGDDDELVRIGMQRLSDQLVGDVRAVEVAGVDVVDAQGHRLAQHRQRRAVVLGRAEHAWACQLHRAVAKAFDGPAAEPERAGTLGVGHLTSP